MQFRKRYMAELLIKGSANPKATELIERKKKLFAGLSGNVLELGPGAGVNLRYLPTSINWIGVEPNAYLKVPLETEAKRLGFTKYEVHQTGAEVLPASDGSMDAVISTQVLCSVKDPVQVLREVKRVLKPNGVFIYIEHVAAARGWLRIFQKLLTPFWRVMMDGCRLSNDTLALIEAAGFTVDNESFLASYGILYPHIAGTARKI